MKKHFGRAAWMIGISVCMLSDAAVAGEEEPVKVEFVRADQEEVEEQEVEAAPDEELLFWKQMKTEMKEMPDQDSEDLLLFREYVEEAIAKQEGKTEEIPEPPEYRVYYSEDEIICKTQYDEYYKDGWIQSELGKFYFGKDGKAVKGWQEIDGDIYYFSEETCLLQTGWTALEGSVRYLDNETGRMLRGWQTIDGKIFYFSEEDGVMVRGIVEIEEDSYFFDPLTGEQQTGACDWGGNSFYFSEEGTMVVSDWVDDSYYDEDGKLDSLKVPLAKLEPELKEYLSKQTGDWSVYVKMLDTDEEIVIEDHPVTAASLIKLYAMGVVYQEIEDGHIKEDEVVSTIDSMITVSSNDAFNSLVSKVGMDAVNQWCMKNGYEETETHHGLLPAGNGDISDGFVGTNMTSVADCGHILEAIYDKECVSKKASRKMLDHLKAQKRLSKIPAGVPEGVQTANKTGETDDETHDAAIVFSPSGDYILCVMGSIPGNAWSCNSIITDVSRMVYDYLNP